MANLVVTIEGTDRSTCIVNESIRILDKSNESASTMTVEFSNRDEGAEISLDDEIIVTLDSDTLFAGYVLKDTPERIGDGRVIHNLTCIDYNRDLDRRLVVESYEGMTDREIILDIIANYCPSTGITDGGILEGVEIKQIVFNYVPPSQCLSQICELTGRSWYLDYNKGLHYFPKETTSAPFNIDDNSLTYDKLKISKDNSKIKNRVYVRGGSYLSDSTTIYMVADGEQTIFNLPDKPSEMTVEVWNGASYDTKTLGIKHVDDSASFDYLLNYQEKYIECTGSAPAEGTSLKLTYKYYIPVLVAVEDKDSIEDIGVFEYAIFDKDIKDLDQARDRASAEISTYAEALVSGSFSTTTNGFRAGQYINIDLTDYDVDANYLVKSVTMQSLGGDSFDYIVEIVSAETLGILQFLIKLLEQDKKDITIGEGETVDELYSAETQTILLQDSLIEDSLRIPPYQWGSFKWGVAEWN